MKQSIVQIITDEERVTGAGFLATGDGIIVTCAHVIENANAKPGDEVYIRFVDHDLRAKQKALVLNDGWRGQDDDDLAFIRILGIIPKGVTPLALGFSENTLNHEFQSFGFPEMKDLTGKSPFDGVWANGSIVGEVKRRGGQKALQLTSHEVDLGFSGSPIVDRQTQRVIGIITEAQGTSPNKKQQLLAWGTPSESIMDAFPDIYIWPLMQLGETNTIKKLPPRIMHPLVRAEFFSGRQRQLSALRAFWKNSATRVFSLVGIGGCGKTAIVHKFLELERWLIDGDSAEHPDGVFIWSFYDSQDTTAFITEAYSYFSQSVSSATKPCRAREGNANVFQLAELLRSSNGKFIIVMDGLEKIQEEGNGSSLPRGMIVEPAIRHLLTRIVDGVCGKTKAIVTSRFNLSDLLEWSHDRFKEIDTSELEPNAARKLLMKLGVKGSALSLDLLASEYGRHALTLDLLGRFLAEYYEGDACSDIDIPLLELAEGTASIERQAARLSRVLRGYERRLKLAELKILDYLSVFRRPVEYNLLSSLLCEQPTRLTNDGISIEPNQLAVYLHKLADRRLIIIEKDRGGELYTSHPAIRDHFYIRLTSPKNIHEIVRSQLVSLTDAPGFIKPRETHSIDLIEELVYHSIKTGKTRDAYSVYRGKLGYRHLGWDLGDHARGAGMMRLFDEQQITGFGDISLEQKELLAIDHGLYLKNLGVLDLAIKHLEEVVNEEAWSSIDNRASAFQNLSAVEVLRGRLVDAETAAISATQLALESSDERLLQDCRVRLGTAYALRGKAPDALVVFGDVKKILTRDRQKTFPRDLPGIRLGWLLMRLGRLTEAEQELRDTRELSEYFGFHIIVARADLALSELAFIQGRNNEAIKNLEKVYSWASGAFDQEMVVAANLLAAEIALSYRDFYRTNYYINDGLRIAEECGYSIYWIDQKILQGRLFLQQRNWKSARECAKLALEGTGPRAGHPNLFGANSPNCGYEWGKADATQLLAESLIELGQISDATDLLRTVLNIRSSLGDPAAANVNTLLEKCK